MKKFGFGKKKEGEDAGRDALFGSRGRADNASNPYAQQSGTPDPYASPGSGGPPPYSNGNGNGPRDQWRQEKTAAYGAGAGAGAPPSNDRFAPSATNYGAGRSGYGADPYSNGGGQQPQQQQSRYGGGGYGNFGGEASNNPQTEARRNELFGGAQERPVGNAPAGGAPSAADQWNSGRGDGYGAPGGGYGDRQLTAEEQEEEDIQASKNEIRALKQQDVASTRNALRIAAMAEETGRSTLERLGAQGESIHNTEKNLDLASNQNKLAAEKARELKTLNRSMFAVHVSNPFTSSRRTREREERVLDDARKDREQRDATRNEAWGNAARQQEYARDLNRAGNTGSKKKNLAERSKYQFEADSEDEQMEDEIDSNLDQLHGAAKRLNHLAGAMGKEVDVQNKHLERIGGKVDRVDDEIALNRSRLDRIK